jgi:hypothetical protein
MERMVDNVSQTGLRVGSLNQCWMVIGNRNRPLAVLRVSLRVHDQGSQETQKQKNQRNDSDLLTMVLWVVHLQVHSWLSFGSRFHTLLDALCRLESQVRDLHESVMAVFFDTRAHQDYSVSRPKLPTPHPVTQTRKWIWSVRFMCMRPCELIPYQKAHINITCN